MKRMFVFCLAVALASLVSSVAAMAGTIEGTVSCDQKKGPLSGIVVTVVSVDPDHPFTGSATSDVDGFYSIDLPAVVACYRATIDPGQGGVVVSPASGEFDFCVNDPKKDGFFQDWIIASPKCGGEEEGACWLTGGGARFSSITGTLVGDVGKRHNWGGNVNPGCSPTAGDGGSWNDIDATGKLHFHGTHIEVVRCGNVDGIPPGSTSPVTPFNFIEFKGWGTLRGISGNKADFGTVYFFARAEDRNEPGSTGQRDGAGKDRYFLKVFTDPSNENGSVKILVDIDGDPATVDPLIITDGNMQIHISSCDNPPPLVRQVGIQGAAPGLGAPGSWGALKVIYR